MFLSGVAGNLFNDRRQRAPPPPAILIVEDEALIRLALADYLQVCGYHVFEAGSAAEAIAIIQQTEIPIDLVFTDVRMPGEMNGWALDKWIRENHSQTPVIVASAERQEAAHTLCQELPFLHKPYEFDVVVARIQALTRKVA